MKRTPAFNQRKHKDICYPAFVRRMAIGLLLQKAHRGNRYVIDDNGH